MKKINRRVFISQTGMALGAAWIVPQLPAGVNAITVNHPIGFQTFPIRDLIVKDFAGTLKMMAGLGYKEVEMCSPSGYVSSGFGPLASMKGAEMRRIINDAGLSCPSCHFTFGEMTDKLDESIAFAKDLGLSLMVCSSFWLQGDVKLKDYLDSADKLNKIAEKINKAGMQTGFHNHDMEFHKLDGELIYDALLARLDPALVKMQFQTQVIQLGYKAADYFTKYPGRFISSHLSDWTTDKKQVPIGQGMIDWVEFFAAAEKAGVKHFYVEMNLDTYKDSAAYIKSLKA